MPGTVAVRARGARCVFVLHLFLAFALLGVTVTARAETATAIFAGGCFWCVEADFDKLPGVVETISGYAGGREANPTYEQVSAHRTGHVESVQVRYDAARVSYATLVDYFFRHVDPLTADGQFCDKGPQYRTVIFFNDDAQRKTIAAEKEKLEKQLGKSFVTEVTRASTFYPAEEYHQDYYRKNPLRYRYYRLGCGRDARVKEVWG
jgi:peptide-methionine (S)-S-oxide reductase